MVCYIKVYVYRLLEFSSEYWLREDWGIPRILRARDHTNGYLQQPKLLYS